MKFRYLIPILIFFLLLSYLYLGSYSFYKTKVNDIDFLYRVNRFTGKTHYTFGDGKWKLVEEPQKFKNSNSKPIPDSSIQRIEIKDTKFSNIGNYYSISGEILNFTKFVITEIDFKLDIYNCHTSLLELRKLYNELEKSYTMPDFSSFLNTLSKPGKLEGIFEKHPKDLRSFNYNQIQKSLKEHIKSEKSLLLSRRISKKMLIEPTLSHNISEKIFSQVKGDIYSFYIEKAYGYFYEVN